MGVEEMRSGLEAPVPPPAAAMATSSTALIPVWESTEDHIDRYVHVTQTVNAVIPLIARIAIAVRMAVMREPWAGSRNREGRGRRIMVMNQNAAITAGGVLHKGKV